MQQRIRDQLASHLPVADSEFDELLSAEPRAKSLSYWSRVEVAQMASRWLIESGARRTLDVGSGAGKFCAIASLMSARRVWGVEVRASLVHESRSLAQQLGADVEILEGALESVDVSGFDSFYFFNPFQERLSEPHECYDSSFTKSVDRFLADVRVVERWLRRAPLGTVMVTYNGLGGRIPVSWVAEKSMILDGDTLRLWVKTRPDESTDAVIEFDDHLVLATRMTEMLRRWPGHLNSDGPLARLAGSRAD